MIQNPGRCWINVASSSAYKNDSCTKSVGSDFFNSLSHNRKSLQSFAVLVFGWQTTGDARKSNFGHSRSRENALDGTLAWG
jgi:hypothetical protein